MSKPSASPEEHEPSNEALKERGPSNEALIVLLALMTVVAIVLARITHAG